ncbi:hypothetical protein BDV95DRAFT_650145 [Massariosphaeria phaeospora]|uniref:Uncharacterized protein n=1 Tax=Massariosphaeria phaeospora TaxID=100035 RepID=A0A7C8MGB6_9PLEO|nr:hypothetical protein BDV95DRAFT_650145 [Massariosphaeria phaeospora]
MAYEISPALKAISTLYEDGQEHSTEGHRTWRARYRRCAPISATRYQNRCFRTNSARSSLVGGAPNGDWNGPRPLQRPPRSRMTPVRLSTNINCSKAQQSQRNTQKTTNSADVFGSNRNNTFGSNHTSTFGSSHKQAATQEDSLFILDTRQTGIPPNPAWHENINLMDRAMKDVNKGSLKKTGQNRAERTLLNGSKRRFVWSRQCLRRLQWPGGREQSHC